MTDRSTDDGTTEPHETDDGPDADSAADEGLTGSTQSGSAVRRRASPDGGDGSAFDDDGSLRRYAELAALGVLSLLALVAVFRFYQATSRAIDIWISSDFVPVVQASFNLVVLLLAVAGVSVLLRRRYADGELGS